MNPTQTKDQYGNITNVSGTPVGNTFDVSKLTGTPIVPPPQNQSSVDLTSLIGSFKQQVNNGNNEQSKQTSDISNLMNQLTGQTTEQQSLESAQGIDQKTKDLNELQKIANQKQAEYIANTVRAEGASNIRQETNVVQQNLARQNAIDTILTNSLISAKQGDINFAQHLVDKAMTAKYEPIKQEIENKKFILSQLNTKLAKDQSNLLDLQLKGIEEQKANEKGIQNIGMKLSEFGVDTATVQKVLKASNINDAIAIAGANLRDPKARYELEKIKLDNQLTKEKIITEQKQRSLLGEPTPKEKKDTEIALKEAKSSVPVMQDKILAVDTLLNHSGLDSRVGSTMFTRSPTGVGGVVSRTLTIAGIPELVSSGIDKVSGSGQDFAGGVHKLVSGLSLQSLIDAKARGATFGALSEGELNILANSASTINDWEIKDNNGRGTGVWNIDETSFKKELNNIKTLTARALQQSQGTVLSSDEKDMLNSVYGSDTPLDPSNYFNQSQ